MNYLMLFLMLCSQYSFSNNEEMIGKWDLVSSETIESIRYSDGHLLGDMKTQSLADEMFRLALDSIFYEFKKDTLFYTDLLVQDPSEPVTTITRRAIWALNGDTLRVKELDRNYYREYFIKKLSKDSLSFTAIINGSIHRKGGFNFVKVSENKP